MAKKTTVKKIKKEREKTFKLSTSLFALLALILTIALFFGLIVLQNFLSEEVVYMSVITAKTDIPEGVIITKENADQYLQKTDVNSLTIPRGTLMTADEILGQRSRVPLMTGEMLSVKDFANLNPYIDNLKEPVELSIAAGNASDTDGGKIRQGDLINITMMFTNEQLGAVSDSGSLNTTSMLDYANDAVSGDPFTDFKKVEDSEGSKGAETYVNAKSGTTIKKYHFDTWAQYVMEGLYVSQVLNSDGQVIAPEDTDSTAAMFIFVIEKADEADFNNVLVNCSGMRISKNLNLSKSEQNVIDEEETKEDPLEQKEEPVSTPEPEKDQETLRKEEDSDYLSQGYFRITEDGEGTYTDEEGKKYQIGETEDRILITDEDRVSYEIGVHRTAEELPEGEKEYLLIRALEEEQETGSEEQAEVPASDETEESEDMIEDEEE